VGCGGSAVDETEGDNAPDCVGSYSGTYAGDVRGTIDGTLSRRWTFTVTFSPNNSDTSYTIEGSVDEDGQISEGDALSGTFNFNRCRANGEWNTGEADGTWNAALQ
jgi:hypothetical protein